MALAGTGRPAPRGTARRRRSDKFWAGSRYFTNLAIEHIDGIRDRPAINSRKRLTTLGNPASDHFVGNVTADAVDFNLVNDQRAATRLAKRFGWRGAGEFPSFGTFTATNPRGRKYRIQIIWTTHGTGPHLHFGVKRI
jgi:hypothetical protein